MDRRSEGGHGKPVLRHRPTSLDLILSARAMRYQWFVAALTGLQARLRRLAAALAVRPRPDRAPRPAYAQLRGADR